MRELIIARIKEYCDGSRPQLHGALRRHGWIWSAYYPDKLKNRVKPEEVIEAMLIAITAMNDSELLQLFEAILVRGNRQWA